MSSLVLSEAQANCDGRGGLVGFGVNLGDKKWLWAPPGEVSTEVTRSAELED